MLNKLKIDKIKCSFDFHAIAIHYEMKSRLGEELKNQTSKKILVKIMRNIFWVIHRRTGGRSSPIIGVPSNDWPSFYFTEKELYIL